MNKDLKEIEDIVKYHPAVQMFIINNDDLDDVLHDIASLSEAILKWHNKKVLMVKKSYYSRGFNDCSNGQLYEPIKGE